MTQRTRMIRTKRGQAMVEAALTLIIFLTSVIGLIEFSRGVWTYNLVAHLSREGTRYAIVRGKSNTTPATVADIKNAVQAKAIGLTASKLTTTVNWYKPDGTTGDNTPGNDVKVNVSYAFSFMTPFVSRSNYTLKSTSRVIVLH